MRLLVLCTHNSARSQIAEGWLRHYARLTGLDVEVWSAGTEATRVNPQAIGSMREAGVDITAHSSKSISDIPHQWNFDLVLTVCDRANEACPIYPARTTRLHVSFPDPSLEGGSSWSEVRDSIAVMSHKLITAIAEGRIPSEEELLPRPSLSANR